MVLDSTGLACALALFAASIGACLSSASLRAGARLYLRFAAMLFAALAASFPLGLSGVASLLVLPLSAGALLVAGLALSAAPFAVFTASLTLVLGLACGLGAALTDMRLLAVLPAMVAGLVILGAGLKRAEIIAALAGAALILAALSCWNDNAPGGVFLFCAAALVGLARPAPGNQLLRSSNKAWRGAIKLP
jgi:hypothetical protein